MPEFPKLSGSAFAAAKAGKLAAGRICTVDVSLNDRKFLAGFLREAMKQSEAPKIRGGVSGWSALHAIADNLWTPPPPPTLAEAKEAARRLAGPSAEVVHVFLASLGEGS